MNRHAFNYLENITYNFHDTKQQIKEIEEELLNDSDKTYDDVMPGRTSVGENHDATATKAIALIEDRRLSRLREQAKAVESAYNSLIDEKKELIKLYYWEGPIRQPMIKYANKLNISTRTAYRWRREYIYELAKILGEI